MAPRLSPIFAATSGDFLHVGTAPEPLLGYRPEDVDTRDVTDRQRTNRALDAQNDVLAHLAAGAPLPEVLAVLCRQLDRALEVGASSIMLVDESGERLQPIAAPNAPPGLIEAIASLGGIPVGPDRGACGTAVYRRAAVISEAISTDPLWTDYAALARECGIASAWSVPIFDPDGGAVLGAFAAYHAVRRRPSGDEMALVEEAGRLAAIAIRARRAEERLRESELRYRSLVERLPAVVYTLEIDGDVEQASFRYVGPRIESLLGVPPTAVLRQSGLFLQCVHPEDRPGFLATVRAAHAADQPLVAEYRLVRPDGEIRWVRDEAAPVGSEGDQRSLWQGVLLDITAQRAAEAAVRASEARFASLIRHATDVIGVLDRDGIITYVAPSIERILGYQPAELVGTNGFALIHPEDVATARDAFPLHRPHGVPGIPLEFRIRHRDGSWRWFEAAGSNLLADPAVQGVVINARDVTDRRTVEARLRLRDRAIAAASNGIAIADATLPDTPMIDVNAAFERITGYTAAECFGRNCRFLQGSETDPAAISAVRVAAQHGRECRITLRNYRKDGTPFWNDLHVVPIRDDQGRVTHILSVLNDVTEHKDAETALRTAEARFRTLVEQLPAVVYIEDLDSEVAQGRFPHSYVSPQAAELLGHTAEEWEAGGELWEQSLHPDDRERVLALDRHTEVTGDPFQTEYRIIAGDGRLKWVRDEAVLIRDQAGQPLYWQGLQRDITDQKLAEERLSAAEARYRHLVERLPAVAYLTSADGPPITYIGPQIEPLLGYAVDEWHRDPDLWVSILHPDDRAGALAELKRSLRLGEPFQLTYRVMARDGHIVWVRDETRLIRDDDGRPLYRQGLVLDISAQQEAEAALRRNEQEFRLVFAANPHPMWILDRDSLAFLEVNDAAVRHYGYSRDEFLQMTMTDIQPAEDREQPSPHLAAERLAQARSGEWRHRLKDHRTIEVEVTSHPLDFRGRSAVLVVAVDVTDRTALAAQLAHQAFHDPLTGLPNRALFLDRLGHALRRAGDRPERVAVLFLDLDDFKRVNDTLGHGVGDDLLVAVADRFRACLRQGDTVARLGGDEFTFLLEDVDQPEDAPTIAERIAEEMRPPFRLAGRELYVTFSVGITTPSGPGDRAEDLLRSADVAMYAAKRGGRARYAVFERAMDEQAWKRLELEADLRRAVIAGEFCLHYQPIVSLVDGRAIEVEALVRWEHPTLGLVPPSDFVPLAEMTGLIVPLGRWVLGEACRQAADWRDKHPTEPPLGIAVNLSARQLQAPELVADVAEALARSALDPRLLTLEITETTAVEDVVAAAAVVRELRTLGVRLAIDDFGAGYSGLSYLRRCPVDALKIDRAYVARLDAESGDVAMIRAVLAFAHTLGLRVTAEGVESAVQLAHLQALGCESAQGYFFARPAPTIHGALFGAGHRFDVAESRFGEDTARPDERFHHTATVGRH